VDALRERSIRNKKNKKKTGTKDEEVVKRKSSRMT